jgi:regulator of sigma E protease
MDILTTVLGYGLSFLVVISVVITVHELGHYWVGRIFNAAAESFSIGFGRSIFEVKDKRGTRWRINWMPIGGFVKFVGEIQAPTDSHEPVQGPVGRAYPELGPWKRMAISLGGPFANFVFAIFVFAAISMTLGVPQAKEVSVAGVAAGEPAEAAGFRVGDVIVEAAGRPVKTSEDVTRATVLMAGEPVSYRVLRDGRPLELIATPVQKVVANEALDIRERIGRVGLELQQRDAMLQRLNPIDGIVYGVAETGTNLSATLTVLRRLITGKDGLDKLSGPLGIIKIAGAGTDVQMRQEGVSLDRRLAGVALWLIQLAAFLSIGVGFFNLLPIPILDGGAVVMCAAEVVTGRETPEKVVRVGQTIGFFCLIGFALVITWNDIGRYVPGWPGAP